MENKSLSQNTPAKSTDVIVRIPEPTITRSIDKSPQAPQRSSDSAKSKRRLLALDAFRGLTIALMLLVNNMALGDETPAQLTHAPWNEMIHLADLVFPWFLFCAGIAIPFAAASFKRKGLPSWRYDVKVIFRASILVLLGCLIESSLEHQLVFTLGVLQVIGLAYLAGALLYELSVFRRLLIAAGMLIVYWLAIKFVPIPGVGIGLFEERQNLIWYINQQFLGAVRLWGHTVNLWGLPSIIPTSALVLIGTVIGDFLQSSVFGVSRKVSGLVILGVTFIAGGFLWNHSLPFSKALWTPAYILIAAGTGTLVLSILYSILDAHTWSTTWAYPLIVFGSNAILAYVAPILIKILILEEWRVGTRLNIEQWSLTTLTRQFGMTAGGWCYTLMYITVWWLILMLLYRKKIFIRV